MKKPHLSDFNLTEESFQEERSKRSQLRFVIFVLSVGIGIANVRFWIWSESVIGGWSILGLILTFYGLVPGIFCGVVLDGLVGKRFYHQSTRYEKAKAEYNHGKFVLLFSLSSRAMRAGVRCHAQVIEDQACVAVELAHFLGDAAHGFGLDHTDSKAA
jgi:hypothetical protein